MLDNAQNQPPKFRTKNSVEINDESRGVYNTSSNIRFKTTRSSLCDYSDAYILVKGRIAITGEGNNAAARQADERNKGEIFKNCAPFTTCKSKINNKEIDKAEDIDIVLSIYNLMEYSNNYSKTAGSLWQYYKDVLNDNLAESESFKSKVKIKGNTPANSNTKDDEIIVPLKYLSNFGRTLEILLINCEVSLTLPWSLTWVTTNSAGTGRFIITDAKLCFSCNFVNSR